VATVELLLEAGADPRAKDAHGKTPLGSARSPRVVDALGGATPGR